MVVEDHLLHPDNLKLAKHIREGGVLQAIRQPSSKTKTELSWERGIAQELHSALKTGDLGKLAQLLKENPHAIAHPVVFRQIFHLRKLTRMLDVEALGELEEIGGCPHPDETILPAGTRRAARNALEKLLSAWIKGILPGYKLEPAIFPKRPGAKRKEDRLEFLLAFNDLLEKLNQQPPTVFKLGPTETKKALIDRIARVVREIHTGCRYCGWELEPVPGEPKYDRSGKMNLYAFRTRRPSFPLRKARDIARQAVEKRKRLASKNDLIYSLLGHCTRRGSGSIRGIIQRAQEDHPELALRSAHHW